MTLPIPFHFPMNPCKRLGQAHLSRCTSCWTWALRLTAIITLSATLGLSPTTNTAHQPTPVELLVVRVLAVRPHDPEAFTQGLLYTDGTLYESTGLHGESSLREVDWLTGGVLRRVDLSTEFFAEGLALVGDNLYQLTWREGIAFRYNRHTFRLTGIFHYTGEGWGLCFDGKHLYRSDGSEYLTIHDPDTFVALHTLPVTLDDQPIFNLNELECVGDSIYANIWYQDTIVRIDKASGQVTALIVASDLLTSEERKTAGSGAVLNGIAYVPERDTFLITGKLWPHLFEVQFVEETP